MKPNAWILAGLLLTATMLLGCGAKEKQQVASATTASGAATSSPPPSAPSSPSSPPSNPAASPSRPSVGGVGPAPSGAENEIANSPADEPTTGTPSRPSVGGVGGPDTGAPVVAAPPSRPSVGGVGGPDTGAPAVAAPPSRPSVGGVGGPNTGAPALQGIPGGFASNVPVNASTIAPQLADLISLSLRDRAVNAFKAGNSPMAYALFQAHALSVPSEEVESLMGNMRWDKKGIVPRLGYNFAVGLIIKNANKVESLKPIGTDLEDLRGTAPGGAGGGSRGFGGPPGGGTAAGKIPALPARELTDAAGTFAYQFVEGFARLHSEGQWSEAFREYEIGSSSPPSTGFGGFASGAPGGLGGFGGFGGSPAGGPPAGYGGGAQGGPPAGYGGGGPPAGYAGGGSGAPAGYGGGASGPPAGYQGGAGAGAPPGYGGGSQGGPPAGYRGGAGAGAPPGYGGGSQGGPPAGYRGGAGSGPPAGYGGGSTQGAPPQGAPPSGAAPPAGDGKDGSGGSSSSGQFDFVAPDDQDDSVGFPGTAGAPPAPGIANPAVPSGLTSEMLKELQLPSGVIPLAPGLNYIGKGESLGELSKLALEQNYDALIVFEVEVSFLRVNSTVKNDCRIKVIRLQAEKDAKEKAIISNGLNNRDVALEKDPDAKVSAAVNGFLKKMSEAFALEDLPNFKAESIQGKRLKDLVNDKARSKLDLLNEIELYASKGLIDDALKLAAFEKIAGPDGLILATGTPEEKLPIVEKMVRRRIN